MTTYKQKEFRCPKCGVEIVAFTPTNIHPQDGIVDLEGTCGAWHPITNEPCDNTCKVEIVGHAEIEWRVKE